VVTFGEFLLRLSPPFGERISETNNLEMNYGGAEANVAVSLAQLGLNSKYISAIPGNQLGDNGIKKLRKVIIIPHRLEYVRMPLCMNSLDERI